MTRNDLDRFSFDVWSMYFRQSAPRSARQPALSPEDREGYLRFLTCLLVDHDALCHHIGRSRIFKPRRTKAQQTVLTASEGLHRSTDQILQSGLTGLSDDELRLLATNPIHLQTLATLIDEAADAASIGPVWWEAIERVGAAVARTRARFTPPADWFTTTPPTVPSGRDELFAAAANTLRVADPSDLLAGGTAEEFVRQWAAGRIAAWCLASDPDLFAALERNDDPAAVVPRLVAFLSAHPGFALVAPAELTTLATAVVAAFRTAD